MARNWILVAYAWGLGAGLLSACGGTFSSAGGGGSGGAAGSGSGGASGSCVVGAAIYPDGAAVPSSDGCNTCSCQRGDVACTQRACGFCRQGDQIYQPGDTFPADDGCNTCTCQTNGLVACTELGCVDSCMSLEAQYSAAMDLAKSCKPGLPNQCTKSIFEGLTCGCDTFVNPNQASAVAAVSAIQKKYQTLACGVQVTCGACGSPTTAYCSAAGRCESVTVDEGAAACLVGGVIYASGSSGISDPTSCNQCSCDNGQLSCTEIYCPIECPAGTAPGNQCAQCGPTDACLVTEFGCLPSCSQDCPGGGLCFAGTCRTVCG
jgi:hypothetical protein